MHHEEHWVVKCEFCPEDFHFDRDIGSLESPEHPKFREIGTTGKHVCEVCEVKALECALRIFL